MSCQGGKPSQSDTSMNSRQNLLCAEGETNFCLNSAEIGKKQKHLYGCIHRKNFFRFCMEKTNFTCLIFSLGRLFSLILRKNLANSGQIGAKFISEIQA